MKGEDANELTKDVTTGNASQMPYKGVSSVDTATILRMTCLARSFNALIFPADVAEGTLEDSGSRNLKELIALMDDVSSKPQGNNDVQRYECHSCQSDSIHLLFFLFL